jgi:hypothetical protein
MVLNGGEGGDKLADPGRLAGDLMKSKAPSGSLVRLLTISMFPFRSDGSRQKAQIPLA